MGLRCIYIYMQVSLYGPGNIPLFPFGSSLLDIDQLFDLSSYNIQIADRTGNDTHVTVYMSRA